ncbi:MAG TPA: ferrous iron transporter B [Allosphingosinicella sp.]|nr:ferrous iron transporter B [Allosphingosinicella sp.]
MTSIPLVAVVGNPNAGKSALFNMLTGARQKVGNYPGVTVERKSGRMALADGRPIELVDLPGAYSLDASSPDEAVTRDVVLGRQEGERLPDALLIVLDATNLDNHLRFALQVIGLGFPTVVALNMVDLARRDGLTIDKARLAAELGAPVIETVAVRKRGMEEVKAALGEAVLSERKAARPEEEFTGVQRRARAIASAATVGQTFTRRSTLAIDKVVLHPVGGLVFFFALMFLMFQAVFAWSEAPMGWIEAGQEWLGQAASAAIPEGFLRDVVVQGIIAGVGAVIVFLPQILILFLFILLLEATGYMVRAAFLMDKLMAKAGLSGHAFIPLLSSFACAIPGIMATRTIEDPKQRLTTILIAPLMTCAARLPVYGVIIGAVIPATTVGLGIGLQGLVMFGLYVLGIVGALLAGFLLRKTVTRGASQSFIMEMPKYQAPHLRPILIGLWQRGWAFLKRAGGIILAVTIALWLLSSYPVAPEGQKQTEYSIAGRIASGIEVVVRPIGFNHEIALALLPSMAAREVAVTSLQTVYAIDAEDEETAASEVSNQIAGRWSLATALAFLIWFVFAPQCLSTIAVARRETNGWKWPLFMLGYLFALAYVAAGATYWIATAAGL